MKHTLGLPPLLDTLSADPLTCAETGQWRTSCPCAACLRGMGRVSGEVGEGEYPGFPRSCEFGELDTEEYDLCPTCNGTGGGDDGSCSRCGGDGEIKR